MIGSTTLCASGSEDARPQVFYSLMIFLTMGTLNSVSKYDDKQKLGIQNVKKSERKKKHIFLNEK